MQKPPFQYTTTIITLIRQKPTFLYTTTASHTKCKNSISILIPSPQRCIKSHVYILLTESVKSRKALYYLVELHEDDHSISSVYYYIHYLNHIRCSEYNSGYPLKLYFQIPCVFPVRPQIFPVSIYIICEYYIQRTNLADLSSFWKKNDLDKIPCVFPVLRQNSLCFPCVLTKFQIPCVFPDIFFFAISPVFLLFPMPWVP